MRASPCTPGSTRRRRSGSSICGSVSSTAPFPESLFVCCRVRRLSKCVRRETQYFLINLSIIIPVAEFFLQFKPRFASRRALVSFFMPRLQALFFVRAPVRALARFIAVSRLAAPAANPEPRFRKSILLSASATDAPPDARPVLSDAGPALEGLYYDLWTRSRSLSP